jgi:hypothetical protein
MKCVFAAALLAAPFSAAIASPADFARGRVVDIDPAASVHRLAVPGDVYEWVVRDDLGDVRVFNGEGDAVAYVVRRPAVTEEQTEWHGLPLYPWPKSDTPDGDGAAVNIELADGGTVVAVRGASMMSEGPSTYLVDASSYEQPIDELQLSWLDDGDNFVASITVEGSDDLTQWRMLEGDATVATLSTDDQRVRVDRVQINSARNKYLRITQTDDGPPVDLSLVSARSKQTQAPQRNWKRLDAKMVDEGFEFDTEGRFPIDRITIEHDSKVYLTEAHLFSRANDTQKWRDRGQRTFYRAAVDGRVVTSDPIKYAAIYEPLWRAEILTTAAAGPPTLTVGWAPDEVVFLRQGPPPFTLAYGKADTPGQQWPMGDLLRSLDAGQDLNDLPTSPLGEAEMLGGPDRLLPAPEPINWRNVVLWAVLVIGVVVIGGLALRLARAPAS